MSKGEDTRSSILSQALHQASEVGLEGLTVGTLASKAGMSKSGLYAHFGSKEDLQCQVLDAAAALFVDVVMTQTLKQPRGLPRVRKLYSVWLDWATRELSGGCLFIAAATEYDDREGPVRDRLIHHLRDVLGAIARAGRIAVEEGHFLADLDVEQFAYEFWAILLGYHHYVRLLRREDARQRADQAFERLIQDAMVDQEA